MRAPTAVRADYENAGPILSQYRHEQRLVTPDMAREFLARQWNNRPVSKYAIEAYARTMDAGNWLLTPSGLLFNEHGRMVDGQHRCRAIIKHGKPVSMVLVFNVPDSVALHAIDAGKARSTSDRLGIDGRGKHARKRVAIIRLLANIELGVYHFRLDLTEYDKAVELLGDNHLTAIFEIGSRISVPVLAAAVLARPLGAELVDDVLRAIVDGNARLGTQAALAILSARPGKGGGTPAVMRNARAACKGMVAVLQDKQVHRLSSKNDGYPDLMKLRKAAGLPVELFAERASFDPEDLDI